MYHKITLFHIMSQKHYERVIFLNSFDLMMERYKKELVDANRRSIEQELLSQSQEGESMTADVLQQEETEPVVSVNAEPQTEMSEETESEM